jgi:hypothetical protein
MALFVAGMYGHVTYANLDFAQALFLDGWKKNQGLSKTVNFLMECNPKICMSSTLFHDHTYSH